MLEFGDYLYSRTAYSIVSVQVDLRNGAELRCVSPLEGLPIAGEFQSQLIKVLLEAAATKGIFVEAPCFPYDGGLAQALSHSAVSLIARIYGRRLSKRYT